MRLGCLIHVTIHEWINHYFDVFLAVTAHGSAIQVSDLQSVNVYRTLFKQYDQIIYYIGADEKNVPFEFVVSTQ